MKRGHKNGQNTAQLFSSVSLEEFILERFVLTLSAIGGIHLYILAIFSVEPNPSLRGNQMLMIMDQHDVELNLNAVLETWQHTIPFFRVAISSKTTLIISGCFAIRHSSLNFQVLHCNSLWYQRRRCASREQVLPLCAFQHHVADLLPNADKPAPCGSRTGTPYNLYTQKNEYV